MNMSLRDSRHMCSILNLHAPTEEQRAIIESPLENALVIAGAGSGKTETLVLRLLWLIASGKLKPESIMGLTFTRKAAGELASRLQKSLAILNSYTGDVLSPEIDVLTYNSFANSIYQDNALLLDHPVPYTAIEDSEAQLIARRLLVEHGLDEDEPSETIDNLASSLIKLDDAIVDNLLDLGELNQFASEFIEFVGAFDAPVAKSDVFRAKRLIALSKLIPALKDEKKLRGRISYSEQVAFALEVCRQTHVLAEFQEKIAYVVLDEYQDTSPIQVEFLKTIFGNRCRVLAVGDPRQAIFGFRGASVANIANFARDFVSNKQYELSISWRNDKNILDLANHISPKIRPLHPRPEANDGSTSLEVYTDPEQEVHEGALWLNSVVEKGTAAVLTRTRSRLISVSRVLDEIGVSYTRADVNIFYEPEVVDILSCMRIISGVNENLSFLRLITGPRWQVGISDLHALRGYIAVGKKNLDRISLLEAVNRINIQKTPMSCEGKKRLEDFLEFFRKIKGLSFLSPLELAYLIEESLNLDIEVQMSHRGRENLDALYELIASFRGDNLSEMLAWFDSLEEEDAFRGPTKQSCPGQVELFTVHSAKGLEWDWVLLPFLDDFPAKSREKSGWLSKTGLLPFCLRLDRESLPEFYFHKCSDSKEYRAARRQYEDDVLQHQIREERKLLYVAVTRARQGLRISASARQKPGQFLREISEFLQTDLPQAVHNNPKKRVGYWPLDSLGTRRKRVKLAAAAVHNRSIEESEESLKKEPLKALIAGMLKELDISVDKPEKRISATALSKKDPNVFLLPQPPIKNAWLGVAFHAWIENYYSTYSDMLFHENSADEYGISGPVFEQSQRFSPELDQLRHNFMQSEWSYKKPIAVELSLEWLIGDVIVPCTIDAVFFDGDRYTILDWKSGLSSNQYRIQLSLYRLAFAEWKGVNPDKVEAKIYFAADNRTIKVRPYTVDELGKMPGFLSDLFS